jgi:hypothetical protein
MGTSVEVVECVTAPRVGHVRHMYRASLVRAHSPGIRILAHSSSYSLLT